MNSVPPQIMPFNFGDESFNPGDSTAVNCMITKGDLPLNIQWTLNDRPLDGSDKDVQIIKMSQRLSSLSIESINDYHRGIVKCIALNEAGTSEYFSELKVNGIAALMYY